MSPGLTPALDLSYTYFYLPSASRPLLPNLP
ncbi:hypothetical protein EMGBD4_14180 [Verrucomicrobiota bacterium]|nr:hypothetical protein EMGBD4_14180 [Verrucomicrobiota bacterium]